MPTRFVRNDSLYGKEYKYGVSAKLRVSIYTSINYA